MAGMKSSEYVNESDSETEDVQFQPPKHFQKYNPSAKFEYSDEKEIWLIKAPKGFPLKDLKTLPVSFTATSAQNGPTPFKIEHNKKRSSFQINEELLSAEAENKKHSIFVNHEKKKTYRVLKGEISRFYNIRQTVEIPEIDVGKVFRARKDVKKIKNLRMRHFPTGYTADDFEEAKPSAVPEVDDEDSDSENERVVKKARVEEHASPEKEKKKKEKKDKKDKKEKKDKKDKKEKKSKDH